MFKFSQRKKSTIYNLQSITSGFTLIELLVVIAIISILAGLLLANFVGIRQRGRDVQRKSDLRQMQAALEMFRSDYGSYPTSLPSCGSAFTSGTATYMQKIPCDPLDGTSYTFSSDGFTYTIYTCIENENDQEKDSAVQSGCTSSTNISFTLTNP